jgi:hypothetical protein
MRVFSSLRQLLIRARRRFSMIGLLLWNKRDVGYSGSFQHLAKTTALHSAYRKPQASIWPYFDSFPRDNAPGDCRAREWVELYYSRYTPSRHRQGKLYLLLEFWTYPSPFIQRPWTKQPYHIFLSLFLVQQTSAGHGHLILEVSGSHNYTPHSVGLLWTRDRSVAKKQHS